LGFNQSNATGAGGIWQVGYGDSPDTLGVSHALVWSGSAASYLDLHQYLPDNFVSSAALGVDASGNIVGYAIDPDVGGSYAVLWTLSSVPEANAWLMLAAVSLVAGATAGWRRYFSGGAAG
jgi:hypothetical protein